MNTVVELEVVVHMFIQDGTSGKYKSKLEPTSLHNLFDKMMYRMNLTTFSRLSCR